MIVILEIIYPVNINIQLLQHHTTKLVKKKKCKHWTYRLILWAVMPYTFVDTYQVFRNSKLQQKQISRPPHLKT
jgi:branched-subunit amino acid permease